MIRYAVLAAACASLAAQPHDAAGKRTPSPEKIVRRLTRATDSQEDRLGEYIVNRRYSVRRKNSKDVDVLEVLWTYKPDAGKEFKILKTEGSSSLMQKALREVVETEAKNSHLNPNPASVTPDHYSFELVSEDETHYKLRLTPRTASKFLVDGEVLMDRESGEIVRLEGKTSKRLSFWVGNAHLKMDYAKTGEFWLPFRTQSTAHVRFFGDVELTINSENYRFQKPQAVLRTLAGC